MAIPSLAIQYFSPIAGAARTGVSAAIKASRCLGKGFSAAMKVDRAASGIVKGAKKVAETRQIWTGTKNKTPAQNAYRHWKDHGKDFPDLKNAKQYVERSHDFIRNPPSGTLGKIRGPECRRGSPGDKILFHPESNTFLIANKVNIPRTMYVPDSMQNKMSALEYFYSVE